MRISRASVRRRLVALAGTAGLLIAGAGLQAAPAAADTAPVPPTTTATVSADALPTVQVNGVVWSTVIVGNRVFASGQFTSARPAGAAAGTNETPRSNILAFDLTTGALITSWAPTLNGTGQTLAASPDGTRVYVAGTFTSVSGVSRNRLVALDTQTGAVVSSFAPSFNARTRSLAVGSDGTVYVGGIFTVVNSQPRERLAAINPANGALLPWAPSANAEVLALAAPPNSGKVFAGGKFSATNGDTQTYGLAMLDGVSGAVLPFAANNVVRNAGDSAAIYSLVADADRVYGTGYTFGAGGNFEGTFAADVATGALSWVTGCRGDEYAAAVGHGVLYYVGHVHDCSSIGGNVQTDPWTFQYAYGQTVTPSGVNQGGTFNGYPKPELLHWLPTLQTGTYTGQSQAGWAAAANDNYVVLGGEFPRVNLQNQQGLVRFAKRAIAPNAQGPQGGNDMNPVLISLAPGTVRVSWKSAWDRDNARLTYTVLKGSSLGSAVPIGTVTNDSTWWNRPNLSLTDTSAAPGTTATYRIRVTDPLGNVVNGNPTSISVPGGTAAQTPYGDAVRADGPTAYWPLGEASGTTGYDWVGADDLTLDASATRNVDGGIVSEPANEATTFSGSASVPATASRLRTGPDAFTTEAWFKTTTTSGGKIIGFGNSNTGNSSGYDRHVYMTNDGRLTYGVFDNGVRTVTTAGSYNDGQWHQVVSTLSGAGMVLYVDGKKVGSRTDTVQGQPYSGWWRIGGDNLGGWPDQPASLSFAGTIDDVAVYPTALTAARVAAHWTASGRTITLPQRPADAYGRAVWDDTPDLYWRHDETSGTAAIDTMSLDPSGTYSSGIQLGQTGSPAAPTGKAVNLPGGFQTVVASQPTSNPTVFSLETWFKTSTTTGGRIIGFGNAGAGGTSGNYDRHVYMFDDGRLRFGIWTGQASVIDTQASYNDGAWHQLVATQGPSGMALYVDGVQVGTHDPVTPQQYDGYWRIGSDNTWGGASTNDFAGQIDETSIYSKVLSGTDVAQHWTAGGGTGGPTNQDPTAAFTSTATDLTASFNASGSADADGTIASYAWNYGDGATGTGVTSSHPYGAAGTYTVTLTVTDDDGATGSVSHPVTVTAPAPQNQAPTAAFTSTATNLNAAFDGTGSTDADGTIASYAWNFGDGGTGTGANATHPYAAAGTYTVTLTVTDDDGATNAVSKQVTVTAPADPAVARDLFGRTVASGLGTADLGGPWTVSASGITVSVADGSGRLSIPAGRTGTARLGSVSARDVDLLSTAWVESMPTGGGVYLSDSVRTTSAGEYRSRLRVQADGKLLLNLSKVVGTTETAITSQLTLPGITYTAGTKLLIRTQAVGTGTTTLRAKVWVAGTTEPTAWTQSVTDTTAELQGAGGVGLVDYASGSSTSATVVRHDDVVATAL
jgi:trimeric autotransporter adhesin